MYTEDGILANLDYECGNGLFDTAMKQPYVYFGLLLTYSLFTIGDNCDAVWSLYNNYEGDDHVKQLLFSSSAVGPILCHKITKDLTLSRKKKIV